MNKHLQSNSSSLVRNVISPFALSFTHNWHSTNLGLTTMQQSVGSFKEIADTDIEVSGSVAQRQQNDKKEELKSKMWVVDGKLGGYER